jgi:NAD(P)-dependent dehydrogenase (short-subunit alcohol dehydrogenase family)
MGRSIALTLAREGARVVVNYLTSEDMATSVVSHITSRGGEAVAAKADIQTAEGYKTLVDAAIAAYGSIDICVIGPGGGWHPDPPEALDVAGALGDAHAELAPIYHLMPLLLPRMYERSFGRIIGISLETSNGSPAYAYNVAKAARTHALKLMCGPAWKNRVTVNIICPGFVAGVETLDEAVELADHGAAWAERKNVTPQDVAEGVAFLASDAGDHVSGCELQYL